MTTTEDTDAPRHPRARRLWAVSEYYAPNFSGAAIQAQRILSRLVSATFQVTVLAVGEQQAAKLRGKRVNQAGVEIRFLRVVRRTGVEHASPTLLSRLLATANRWSRDATYACGIAWHLWRDGRAGDIVQLYVVNEFTWVVVWLANRLGMRTFLQISLWGADDPASFPRGRLGWSRRCKMYCFHHVEKVIGLSQALVRSCIQAGVAENRVLRIPNGVDLESFPSRPTDPSRLRVQLGLAPERVYAIFVGSAIERKGIDVVIEAFCQCAHQVPELNLIIAGPCDFSDRTRHGQDRQAIVASLKQRLIEAACENRVLWTGQIANVAEYLQACDLFFFPTRREGLPNAVAEAMACGLPILASRLEGITTDLVESGVEGSLVDSHCPADYAQQLVEWTRNSGQRQASGRAARSRIEREFALPRIVDVYRALYNETQQSDCSDFSRH